MSVEELSRTRAYYDDFSKNYEAKRRPNDPNGYHAMLDDLEVEITKKYAFGRDLLECGCGTGLLLQRFATFAKSAQGIDLSPGMLAKARERGLDVREGSVTALPFPNDSFDVTCSFKVLAHVEDIDLALSEMARVTRPGGVVLAELYNPWSFRGLAKRFGPKGKISDSADEGAVYTRFDSPSRVQSWAPPGLRFRRAHGVRIVTAAASLMRFGATRELLRRAEFALCNTPLARFAGFYIAVFEKTA